jgi:hypothetical protein
VPKQGFEQLWADREPEPWTYGLRGRSGPEELRGVDPDLIPSGSFVARRVLELAASRDPAVLEAARELAAIVLGRDEVRLARRVLEGGPFAVARAVDLAELVACVASSLPRRANGE